ncbi:MAG TPA: hypothetical protein VET88_04780, partial [Gammaproteobacteria bacterium]|nr:hypothetical protein [Gammaproteobacteria bacterium]
LINGLLIELAGSKGGHFLTPHDGTAEPCQVSPPEAVVYLNVIKEPLNKYRFQRLHFILCIDRGGVAHYSTGFAATSCPV